MRNGRPAVECGGGRRRRRWSAVLAGVAAGAVLLMGCGTGAERSSPPATGVTTPGPASTTPSVPPTTVAPSTPNTAPSTVTTAPPALGLGSQGPAVLALQQRLATLGYWLGTPDGTFGDSTQQAVYALQKAAGIDRDGLVGPMTESALARAVVPRPRSTAGYMIEVDLARDLLMFVTNGKLEWTLNTSTGGGYVYTGGAIADTPVGTFSIFREVDGMVVSNLGRLWRPKYFSSGFAIHGDTSVPPYPVSHGCVRVSDEAIDWIWGRKLAPIGTAVWVYP